MSYQEHLGYVTMNVKTYTIPSHGVKTPSVRHIVHESLSPCRMTWEQPNELYEGSQKFCIEPDDAAETTIANLIRVGFLEE